MKTKSLYPRLSHCYPGLKGEWAISLRLFKAQPIASRLYADPQFKSFSDKETTVTGCVPPDVPPPQHFSLMFALARGCLLP